MPRPELLQFAIDVGHHALDMVDATVQEVRDAIRPPPQGPRGFTRASTEQFSGLRPNQLPPPSMMRQETQQSAFAPGGRPPSPPTRRPLSGRSPAQMAAANGWSAIQDTHGTPPPGLRLTRNAHDVRLAQQASAREQNPSEYHEDDLALAISLSERQSPQWQGPRLNRNPSNHRTTDTDEAASEGAEGQSTDEPPRHAPPQHRHADLNLGMSDEQAFEIAVALSLGGEDVGPNLGLSDEQAVAYAEALSRHPQHAEAPQPHGAPGEAPTEQMSQREMMDHQFAQQMQLQNQEREWQVMMKALELQNKLGEGLLKAVEGLK